MLGRRHIALVALLFAAAPAQANWLSALTREGAELGTVASRQAGHLNHALGPVARAAAHLETLPGTSRGALAAHATPEGHWQFVNREGQVFTAGTADEMQRAFPTLAPDAAKSGDPKLSLYLSEDSVFASRSALDQLPAGTDLYVVTEQGSFALMRAAGDGGGILKLRVKPHVAVALNEPQMLREVLRRFARPLNRSDVRTLAIEPGGATSISAAPTLDAATKLPLADTIDPSALASAFDRLRGRTVLMAGRFDGDAVAFGGARVPLDDIASSARTRDVNLVLIDSGTDLQPGARNWLWQKIEVGGLADASISPTYGDFLEGLARRRGGFEILADADGAGRVRIAARPADLGAGLGETAGTMIEDVVGHVTGEIATNAAQLYTRDEAAEAEVDAQFIPGIPSYIQIPYFGSIIAGLLAWGTTRTWWQRVWPISPGRRAPVRFAREIVFATMFLPLVGVVAFVWQALAQTWHTFTAPFRWVKNRYFRREV